MLTNPFVLNQKVNKILVSGASGMLGKSLVIELNMNPNYEIYCVSKSNSVPYSFVHLLPQEELGEHKFEAFFHCAAEVNVNNCEKDLAHALASNSYYAKFLFERSKAKYNFYISTDSVYEGVKGDYNEIDKVKPINNYAFSKLKGEELSKNIVKNLYVIRTSIVGSSSKNKGSLFEWACKEICAGNSIDGFRNVYFNPLSVGHLAIILVRVLEEKIPFGTYNIGCDTYMSKYDFLVAISKLLGTDSNLIRPIEFKPYPEFANRPLNTTLNCSKIKSYMRDLDLSFQTTLELLITSRNEKN